MNTLLSFRKERDNIANKISEINLTILDDDQKDLLLQELNGRLAEIENEIIAIKEKEQEEQISGADTRTKIDHLGVEMTQAHPHVVPLRNRIRRRSTQAVLSALTAPWRLVQGTQSTTCQILQT